MAGRRAKRVKFEYRVKLSYSLVAVFDNYKDAAEYIETTLSHCKDIGPITAEVLITDDKQES